MGQPVPRRGNQPCKSSLASELAGAVATNSNCAFGLVPELMLSGKNGYLGCSVTKAPFVFELLNMLVARQHSSPISRPCALLLVGLHQRTDPPITIDLSCMKKIGFLSFGHWTPSPQSQTQSAADALLQSIDLAVEAERLGMDGAYFRVHHFARQLASPFPLLAAVGAKTRKIEIGTAVIDMRYENPHYMAEDAGAADLIAGGRLQLGISRGSPEQVIDGWRYFGYHPMEGENDADMGRRHAEEFLELLRGKGFARPNPRPMFPNPPGLLRLEPYSEGLRDRIWWGSASNATAVWAAKLGMNLQTSTLKFDETGEPLHIQQAAQIRAFRAAWKEAGHTRTPRISVSRSIFRVNRRP